MPISTPLAVVAAAALALVPIGPAHATGSGGTTPATYYVACAAGTPTGTGSLDQPFTSLDQINSITLQPGDSVRFRTDTTCTGTFAPQGHGTAQAWITIDSYKPAGAKGNLPVIDAAGATDAALLSNMEYVDISKLLLTNSVPAGSTNEAHNGLELNLHNYGIGTGYRIHDLKIENINGSDLKALNGSAAILVNVTGDGEAAGETPTAFDDLQITNNQIKNVDREGIYFKSIWNKRPEVGGQDYTGKGAWTPSTHVVVSGNQLTSIGGDGMKLDTTQDAVVEHNTITGFQLRSKANNAGLWTFNADGTIVQYNDVSGGGNSGDGMSFDADGGSQNTVFQYNYSHDNVGGLLLVCPYSGAWTHGTIMRYNLSVNDQTRVFQMCDGDIQNTQIYNNTIYNDSASPTYFHQEVAPTIAEVTYSNNIVIDQAGSMRFALSKTPHISLYNNVLEGVTGAPANPDGKVNPGGVSATDVGLTNPSKHPDSYGDFNGYRLRAGSPLLGAGRQIANPGSQDLWGHPIPAAPNIGAYQGAGVANSDLAANIAIPPTPTLPIGSAGVVNTTLTWWGNTPLTPAVPLGLSMSAPSGWQVHLDSAIPTLKQGQSSTLHWSVTPKAKAKAGTYPISVSVSANSRKLDSARGSVSLGTLLPSVAAGYDTVAITDDAHPEAGELASSHSSLSAEALAGQGIKPGADVKGADVTYTWPDYTPGTNDGMWVNGQLLSVNASGQHLGFALFGFNGSPSGTATIVYSDGSSQDFTLAAGDFYYSNPAAGNTPLAVMSYRNLPSGQDYRTVTLFETEVAIDPAKTVDYVVLPTFKPKDSNSTGMIMLAAGVSGKATPTPPSPTPPVTPPTHSAAGSGTSTGTGTSTGSAGALARTGIDGTGMTMAVLIALLAVAAGGWLLRRRRMG